MVEGYNADERQQNELDDLDRALIELKSLSEDALEAYDSIQEIADGRKKYLGWARDKVTRFRALVDEVPDVAYLRLDEITKDVKLISDNVDAVNRNALAAIGRYLDV